MTTLTSRQQQVLDFIREYITGNGYPPTLREIAAAFGLSGPRAAVKHLAALERKGQIVRKPGTSRSIEITSGSETRLTNRQENLQYGTRVPLLGTVPAGPLDLAVEDMQATIILDPNIAGDGSFLLKVSGDSMIGDHILPGDMVLVNRQDAADDGDLVVALIGEEATLKRFRREGEMVTLVPSNPAYDPVVLDQRSDEVKIVGKVKAVIRMTGR